MPLDDGRGRRSRAELDALAPRPASAGAAAGRVLAHAFLLIEHDPDWATWRHYAREYLPAYRHSDGPIATDDAE